MRHSWPMAARSARRTRLLTASAVAGTTLLVVCAALAATSKTIVLTDRAKDAGAPPDLTRVSLKRASDGRLRAVLTFAARISPKALLAGSGPPGSACLRIWTDAGVDTRATPPDRLVCVTARSRDEWRGGVYEVTATALPERVADASIKRTASHRSVVVRFAQSALGSPRRMRFAVEATRPGCARPSCIDTLPDAAGTMRDVRSFVLR